MFSRRFSWYLEDSATGSRYITDLSECNKSNKTIIRFDLTIYHCSFLPCGFRHIVRSWSLHGNTNAKSTAMVRALLQKKNNFLVIFSAISCDSLRYPATLCNILRHFAISCDSLRYPATLCNILRLSAIFCDTQRYSATI